MFLRATIAVLVLCSMGKKAYYKYAFIFIFIYERQPVGGYGKSQTKSGLKAQYLHSPGQRPGYKVFTDNAPCKGSFNIPLFL